MFANMHAGWRQGACPAGGDEATTFMESNRLARVPTTHVPSLSAAFFRSPLRVIMAVIRQSELGVGVGVSKNSELFSILTCPKASRASILRA